MGWFRRKKESEYLQRQVYILSNLGLFYIIIIALFAVPLLGTFVVVLIKGVIDLRMVIIPVVMAGLCLTLFFLIRGCWRFFRRVRADGRRAMQVAREQDRGGQPVQISLFNGLLAMTIGMPKGDLALPYDPCTADNRSLPTFAHEKTAPKVDVLAQLKELVALRESGDIDDQEYELLKAQLIEDSCRPKKKEHEP